VLIVSRREGEKLMIGDDVVVSIVEVSGGTVKLGIDAPRSVPVYREELWAAVRDENRAAAAAPATLPVLPKRG
jgi:carbon storage regulator